MKNRIISSYLNFLATQDDSRIGQLSREQICRQQVSMAVEEARGNFAARRIQTVAT